MAECKQCGKEYKAKRSTSKYCSSKCRKLVFREAKKNAKPGTVIPIEARMLKEPEIRDEPIEFTTGPEWSASLVDTNPTSKQGSTEATNLPACVPSVIRDRYARGEPDYVAVIDCLLAHTLDELNAEGVWIPVWRIYAGQEAA